MKKVQINTKDIFELIIKDEKGNLIDVDDYQFRYRPKAVVFNKDNYICEPYVERKEKGIYYCEIEFFDSFFELSNQYRIDFTYIVKGRNYKQSLYFEIVDEISADFEQFKNDKWSYLINEVRELVFDVNNPILAFSLLRTNSIESRLKLRKNILTGINDNKVEFEINLNEFETLNDLLFYIDETYKEWIVTVSNEVNVRRSPLGLMEFLSTPAASGVNIYFQYFFEDNRLKNIILESLVQFNRDFDAKFTINSFPPEYLFAFKFLVASNVTLVRASTDAKAYSQYFEEGRIQRISLGGKLDIGFAEDGSPTIKRSVNSWLDLSKYYRSLYEDAIKKYNIIPMPLIEMGKR